MSSKQTFIRDNSRLNLNALTTQTTLKCQGFSVLNNSHQDVLIFPGGNNLSTGGVCVGNLTTYPLILQGTISAAPRLQNLASTWSTRNQIIPQQSLLNSVLYYGLSPTQLSSFSSESLFNS